MMRSTSTIICKVSVMPAVSYAVSTLCTHSVSYSSSILFISFSQGRPSFLASSAPGNPFSKANEIASIILCETNSAFYMVGWVGGVMSSSFFTSSC